MEEMQTGSTELTHSPSKTVNTTEQCNVKRTCEHNTALDEVNNTGYNLNTKLEECSRKGKNECTITQEQKDD